MEGNLAVDGSISQTGTGTLHPDYVFERYFDGKSEANSSYYLPNLGEVEAFVRKNKHLPGVQSRADIMEKGQCDVTKNVRTNLEKVEELYLHTIEQQKQIEDLKAENANYKKTLELVLKRLDAIEKKGEL